MTSVTMLLSGVTSGYPVKNSLRFRSSASAYLSRTPSVTGNRQTWTWSGWVKRGALTGSGATAQIFGSNYSAGGVGVAFGSYSGAGVSPEIIGATLYGVGTVTTTPVYRDPSAWYHIVLRFDSTQATQANRFILYVNGVQQTLSAALNVTQNANYNVNLSGAPHSMFGDSTPNGLDGYLAEVNFVDGLSLAPSSFGTYDTNGVWQPIKYSGSFGTNGFYLPFQLNTTSTYSGSFNGTSQWISTPSSATFNLSTGNWTIEGWYFATGTNSNAARYMTFVPATGAVYGILPNSSTDFNLNQFGTGNVFVTTNGSLSLNTWQHIALVKNGTTTTLYVDGVASASSTTAWPVNSNTTLFFGGVNGTYINYFPGKISNVRVVMGTAVYTSNFIPSTSPLTAITNTQLLTLQSSTVVDNSGNSVVITNTGSVTTAVDTPFVANITNDASGNINNWFSQNVSLTAGSTYDSMTDSPTVSATTVANYAVLNPLVPSTGTISNGNLGVSTATTNATATSFFPSSGKWYWENISTSGSASNTRFGIVNRSGAGADLGGTANGWAYLGDGRVYNNGATTSYGVTYTTNDILMIALDLDAGKVWYGKNGTWMASGSPSTGANPSQTFTANQQMSPAVASGTGTIVYAINCGQQPFTYTPPTGFNALNTYNLPTPTIANGAQYMAATTYTGTGATQTISDGTNTAIGTTFQPDLVWIKSRSAATNNNLFDVLRGTTAYLISNSTATEATNANTLTAFGSTGFTVGSDASAIGVNVNAATYVGWQWKANGAGVSNTNGSITSTVSANTTAGFSVVTYTGTGANATIGHGLGVAPNMIITKSRNLGGSHWTVYHSSVGNTGALLLDTTAATNTSINYWNNTSPTSSVFSVGIDGSVNNSGNTFVAYCWSAVSGYSAFGSYTGNGSTDGPFVYTGFRPRFVVYKRTDSAGEWRVFDTSRSPNNVVSERLVPNDANAEANGAAYYQDLLSNGFKVRTTNADQNASGGTYVYAAFAENPFQNSRAR